MSEPPKTKQKRGRAPNPPCSRCRHSVSLHGRDRSDCKAVGCTCEEFVSAD